MERKTDKIIEVEEIQTYYGASHIIQGLSFYVERGESVSILGRNGVGKTTTLRSVAGLTPPRRGSVKVTARRSGDGLPTGLPRKESPTCRRSETSFRA